MAPPAGKGSRAKTTTRVRTVPYNTTGVEAAVFHFTWEDQAFGLAFSASAAERYQQTPQIRVSDMAMVSNPVRFGVYIYDDVEPIDIGGTIGVLSMACRILPDLEYAIIAREAGPVHLAGGLVVEAPYGCTNAPDCDVIIVCGGPGWKEASRDSKTLAFLCSPNVRRVASVCTGALVLDAAGLLRGVRATTRRRPIGREPQSPLNLLGAAYGSVEQIEAAIVCDGPVVTGGGVTLAIDTTLYLLGQWYGSELQNEVATLIEYDRAYHANRNALGVVTDRPE